MFFPQVYFFLACVFLGEKTVNIFLRSELVSFKGDDDVGMGLSKCCHARPWQKKDSFGIPWPQNDIFWWSLEFGEILSHRNEELESTQLRNYIHKDVFVYTVYARLDGKLLD